MSAIIPVNTNFNNVLFLVCICAIFYFQLSLSFELFSFLIISGKSIVQLCFGFKDKNSLENDLVKLYFLSVRPFVSPFFCPRLVLGLSWVCLCLSCVSFYCPYNIIVMPQLRPRLVLMTQHIPYNVFAMNFSDGRLLVRLSKVYIKGTFGPHQALLL